MRGLASLGLRCFLLDWGDPDAEERGFDVADYAVLRALPALDAAIAASDEPVAVLGHCMAGAIAAQAARFRLDRVERLALMASPWDFAPLRPEGPSAPRREELIRLLELFGALFGGVPADLLNSIFFLRDPLQAIRKFSRFTPERRKQPEGRLFVAVEDWLNDGMRLAAPAARTLFVDWGLDNSLLARRWPNATDPLDLGALGVPILVVASTRDTLTPFASASGALKAAPDADLLQPKAGHVGMVVGSAARSELWEPLARWLAP
jgi:polyhydroxyalkanoate synthase